MSLSPSKLGSGSKKTTIRNPTKAGVKSLEPRSDKIIFVGDRREEVQLFKFKGQGKGLLHLPEKQSYTGDTNSKVISVRPAVAEANTPSRRKFVNHTSPPHRMVPSKTKAERPVKFRNAMRARSSSKKYNAREQRLQQQDSDNASTSSNNSNTNDDFGPGLYPSQSSWASSISNLGFRDSPKRPLSMNSMSDGEDNLIHGITPLGSMDFDESTSIPQSPMGVLRGGLSGMYVSDTVDQQQQDKAVISEILNSPLTKYSSPSLSDLFGDDGLGGGPNVFALPESSLRLNTRAN